MSAAASPAYMTPASSPSSEKKGPGRPKKVLTAEEIAAKDLLAAHKATEKALAKEAKEMEKAAKAAASALAKEQEKAQKAHLKELEKAQKAHQKELEKAQKAAVKAAGGGGGPVLSSPLIQTVHPATWTPPLTEIAAHTQEIAARNARITYLLTLL